MSNDIEDVIWTRAETRAGGETPGAGDTALAALIRVHRAVTEGGFARALEILTRDDLEEGAEGYEFFGAVPVRDIVLEASDLDENDEDDDGAGSGDGDDDEVVGDPDGELEEALDALDDRYGDIVVSDTYLSDLVAEHYVAHPDDFAPVAGR